jgi:hypothetical protein
MDVSQIIAYESGELDEDEVVALFQHLIDTGVVWSLQGSYGRMAAALIEVDLCYLPPDALDGVDGEYEATRLAEDAEVFDGTEA